MYIALLQISPSCRGDWVKMVFGRNLRLPLLLLLACDLGCGGGSVTTTMSQNGPAAIINGTSIATANSSWVASDCNLSVELTSDSGFAWVVGTISGSHSTGQATWLPSGTDGAVINFSTGLGGFVWPTSLAHIAGSTSSKQFMADVTVNDSTNTPQDLGTCSFGLQSGPLP